MLAQNRGVGTSKTIPAVYGIWLYLRVCANKARLHCYATQLRLPNIGIDPEACSSRQGIV